MAVVFEKNNEKMLYILYQKQKRTNINTFILQRLLCGVHEYSDSHEQIQITTFEIHIY